MQKLFIENIEKGLKIQWATGINSRKFDYGVVDQLLKDKGVVYGMRTVWYENDIAVSSGTYAVNSELVGKSNFIIVNSFSVNTGEGGLVAKIAGEESIIWNSAIETAINYLVDAAHREESIDSVIDKLTDLKKEEKTEEFIKPVPKKRGRPAKVKEEETDTEVVKEVKKVKPKSGAESFYNEWVTITRTTE